MTVHYCAGADTLIFEEIAACRPCRTVRCHKPGLFMSYDPVQGLVSVLTFRLAAARLGHEVQLMPTGEVCRRCALFLRAAACSTELDDDQVEGALAAARSLEVHAGPAVVSEPPPVYDAWSRIAATRDPITLGQRRAVPTSSFGTGAVATGSDFDFL